MKLRKVDFKLGCRLQELPVKIEHNSLGDRDGQFGLAVIVCRIELIQKVDLCNLLREELHVA